MAGKERFRYICLTFSSAALIIRFMNRGGAQVNFDSPDAVHGEKSRRQNDCEALSWKGLARPMGKATISERVRVPVNHADELDYVDYQILEMLQENARVSAKEISERVFLSSTSVAARIARMEEKGIIAGYSVRINPLALGYYTKAFICVDIEPKQKEEFYPWAEQCENVVQCTCVTGEFAVLLECQFHNTMELDYFIGELQSFGKTKTLIAFSTPTEHREIYWEGDCPEK